MESWQHLLEQAVGRLTPIRKYTEYKRDSYSERKWNLGVINDVIEYRQTVRQ